MHDFARQGTLAGDASLPSDGDTPHRNGSTPNIGRLQRIGAAQLWQVCHDHPALTGAIAGSSRLVPCSLRRKAAFTGTNQQTG